MSNSPLSSPTSPVAPQKQRRPPAPPSSQQQQSGARATTGRGSRQQHTVVVDDAFVEAANRCGISLDEMQPQTSSRDPPSRPGTAPHASEIASSAERRFYNAESLRARKIRMVLDERNQMLSSSPTKAPRPHPPSTLQPPPSPPTTSPLQSTLESTSGPPSMMRASQTRCLESMIHSAARRNQMRQLHSARTSTAKQFLKQQENSLRERAKTFDSKQHSDSVKVRYDAGVISVVNEVQRRSRSAREEQLKQLRDLQEAERLATELSRLQSKEEHINSVRERHAIMLETKQALLQRKHDNKLRSASTRREQQMDSADRTRSQEERIERKLQVANAARAEKLERVRGDAASVRVREEEAREKARLIEKQRKREVKKNIKMKALVSTDHQELVSLTKNLQLKQRVETAAFYTEIAQTKRGAQEELLQHRLDENEYKIQLAQEQKQREIDNIKAALAEENNMKDEWRRTLAKKTAIQQAIRSEEKELAQQEKLEAAAARRDFLLTL